MLLPYPLSVQVREAESVWLIRTRQGRERLICCNLPVVSHQLMGAMWIPQGAEIAAANHETLIMENEAAQLLFDRPYDSLLWDRLPRMQ